jgi:hypothetical protein
MYSVAYVSTAAKVYSDEELDRILERSRACNTHAAITGLLLYKGDNFMQFLEGPQENVLHLLDRIRDDPRHHSMIIVLQQDLPERQFETWSMGFVRVDPLKEAPSGFTDLWDLPFSSEEFLTNPTRSLRFLQSFKMMPH